MATPNPAERRTHRVLHTTATGSIAIKILAAKANLPIGEFLGTFARRMPIRPVPTKKA